MRFAPGRKPPVMPMPAATGAAVKPKLMGAPATPTNPKSGFAIGPQNINPVRPTPAAGPKPAPAGMIGFGRASQEGLDFLRKQPIGVMGQSGPGALDMSKTAGPGALPPGMKKGGKVSSASSRADGCAVKGKTKGRLV